jgi:hypothetical protein
MIKKKIKKQELSKFKGLPGFHVTEHPTYVELPKYAELGDAPAEGQVPNAWCVSKEDLEPFNPGYYFQTSGEGVAKGEKMMQDAWKFIGRLQKLMGKLKKARAQHKFLEIGHENFQVVAKTKDPRVFKDKNRKMPGKLPQMRRYA